MCVQWTVSKCFQNSANYSYILLARHSKGPLEPAAARALYLVSVDHIHTGNGFCVLLLLLLLWFASSNPSHTVFVLQAPPSSVLADRRKSLFFGHDSQDVRLVVIRYARGQFPLTRRIYNQKPFEWRVCVLISGFGFATVSLWPFPAQNVTLDANPRGRLKGTTIYWCY